MSESNGHRVLSWDEIVAAEDILTEMVEVPEWGGCVRMRGLSVDAVLALQGQFKGPDAAADAGVAIVAACMVEPAMPPDGAAALRAKSMGAFQRLMTAANTLCGLGEADAEKAVATFQAGSA